MTHPEVQSEQAYVDRAYGLLEAMRTRAESIAPAVIAETRGALAETLMERDALVTSALRRASQLEIGDEALVFGRTDRSAGDCLYIGRVAVPDENLEPVVIDWRAPAAAPFYRATPHHPMDLVRRRHLICKGRRILDIDDEIFDSAAAERSDLVLMGEAALLAALERSRTGRMRDIVATIQAEQDAIIRAPLEGVLVVQGGPGTGKTAVALHRAAYLLYTHRRHLQSSGVLVVGPNPIFLRYIEHVLPSLGEREVRLATVGQLLPQIRAEASDPVNTARIKGDLRMIEVLANAIAAYQRPIAKTRSFLFQDAVLRLTPQESERIVSSVRRSTPNYAEGRKRVAARLSSLLYRRWLSRSPLTARSRPRSNTAIYRRRLAAFRRSLGSVPSFRKLLDEMWPALTPQRLVRELLGSGESMRDAARGILTEEEQRWILKKRSAWSEHDVALIDEAAALIGVSPRRTPRRKPPVHDDSERWAIERTLDDLGIQGVDLRAEAAERMYSTYRAAWGDDGEDSDSRTTFGHLLVDEAQGLSPIQWRMLARRCPSQSMTIFGDLGQASGPWAPPSWSDVLEHLELKAPATATELTINYRTPAEVMDLAERVLAATAPGLDPPRSIRKTGMSPAFVRADPGDLIAAVERTVASERAAIAEGRVAVIVSQREAVRLRPRLAGEVGEDLDPLDAPVAVLTVEEARGLEFDSVVVVEPAQVAAEHPNGLRALYVALTRTTKRAAIVFSEPLPAPLADSPSSKAGSRFYKPRSDAS